MTGKWEFHMHSVKMLVSRLAEKAGGQWGRRDAPCEALESSEPVKNFFQIFSQANVIGTCPNYKTEEQNCRITLTISNSIFEASFK